MSMDTTEELHGSPQSGLSNISSNIRNINLVEKSPHSVHRSLKQKDQSSLPAESHIKGSALKNTQASQISNEKKGCDGRSEKPGCLPSEVAFDICPEQTKSVVRLKSPLLVKNREKRNEIKRSLEGGNIIVLRSGMVLLKNYILLQDQVKIVRTCRDLGLHSGGFYQPGYRDGAKLHLKMMCLGKNWDPKTSKYDDQRPFDGAKPPILPDEFQKLVRAALQDSCDHIARQSKTRNVEEILPSMSPDICIINFYTNSGRLGLHQDKDESPESINSGLPVVSFSIGDSAEFLYGDERDPEKSEKVILESGDVLIFGGKARNIFHGVVAVRSDTAPKALLEQTNLRPGRLNLTFRQY